MFLTSLHRFIHGSQGDTKKSIWRVLPACTIWQRYCPSTLLMLQFWCVLSDFICLYADLSSKCCHVLNIRELWMTQDGNFFADAFYQSIVNLFSNEQWAEEALLWWNKWGLIQDVFHYWHIPTDMFLVMIFNHKTLLLRMWTTLHAWLLSELHARQQ